jgi:hypothetical protein
MRKPNLYAVGFRITNDRLRSMLDEIRSRADKMEVPVTFLGVLRAGLCVLHSLSDEDLRTALYHGCRIK